MALSAQLSTQLPADRSTGRGAPRIELQLETTGTQDEATAAVLIHNISATGLLIETTHPLRPGDRFTLDLPESPASTAEIVWSSGALHGCRLNEPLSRATLSAAQLRSAISPEAPEQRHPPVADGSLPGATLAQRIAAARKARRLSLGQIAAELGVSRPTIWAWEQGRARPAANRLAALAETLGVTAAALAVPGRDERLADIVEDARQRIAVAAAVPAQQVRIVIEL